MEIALEYTRQAMYYSSAPSEYYRQVISWTSEGKPRMEREMGPEPATPCLADNACSQSLGASPSVVIHGQRDTTNTPGNRSPSDLGRCEPDIRRLPPPLTWLSIHPWSASCSAMGYYLGRRKRPNQRTKRQRAVRRGARFEAGDYAVVSSVNPFWSLPKVRPNQEDPSFPYRYVTDVCYTAGADNPHSGVSPCCRVAVFRIALRSEYGARER